MRGVIEAVLLDVGNTLLYLDYARLLSVLAPLVPPGTTPEEAARRLFAALRSLDRAGVDVIVARDPGRHGMAFTVWDRLFRAAEGRVLDSAHS